MRNLKTSPPRKKAGFNMDRNYSKLLNKVKELTNKGIEWHHHYLPPNCKLNTTAKHLIILESENRIWQAEFDEKPFAKLEELENLFFNRVSR
ncbi:MAG: hypothetical protein PHV63_00035 [Candidatus Daviesbacteria bacterium]|nr:hypothetical protein [Candidatus Daviesbacteria bacterium]